MQQHVPIPTIQTRCEKGCCGRTFIPLALSFARTIHTIQGMKVGPDQEGRPPNAIKRIICDPGPRSFELTNPSTFYVALTQGTTLGDTTKLNSAIYFCGENITPKRLINMTIQSTDDKLTLKCQRRQKWIKQLDKNTHGTTVTTKQ